jgi:large subunit ribosomal protein L23
MAIFGTSTKKERKAAKPAAVRAARDVKDADGRLALVLERPWLSEKALIGTEKGVYVFEIPPRATKKDVARAVEKEYQVVPVKVNVVNLPGKKVSLRTRRGHGTKSVRRKAYVYLAAGQSIQFA